MTQKYGNGPFYEGSSLLDCELEASARSLQRPGLNKAIFHKRHLQYLVKGDYSNEN